MINWKVRLKNKVFWISAVSAVLLIIQVVLRLFGIEVDFGDLGNQLKDVVNAVFMGLALLGVVNDPTTKGISDSEQAMTYDKPKED